MDWTEREVDLIVADYFDMLRMELAGEPFIKARRNAALQDLIHRSRGSIEFKHQNISAVLVTLGLPWIRGYKPMPNFQRALINSIERLLDTQKEWSEGPEITETAMLAETSTLYFEPPPILTPQESNINSALKRLVRKFDPAERDARNRKLGRLGEERILISERARLIDGARPDLAEKVRWVSDEDGDGAGYDILSFSRSGAERLLEVKTTSGHQTTPFYLSENERLLATERPDAFRLIRLYDFARSPRVFKLTPPIESLVTLSPTNYRASFNC